MRWVEFRGKLGQKAPCSKNLHRIQFCFVPRGSKAVNLFVFKVSKGTKSHPKGIHSRPVDDNNTMGF